MAENKRAAADLSELRIDKAVPYSVEAVSYTHLDVYKRQFPSSYSGYYIGSYAHPDYYR